MTFIHFQHLDIEVLEMDERHGYVNSKATQCWDAVTIDATSKFVVQVEVGERTEPLFERLASQCRPTGAPPRPSADDGW